MRRPRQGGFTLVEPTAVLVIAGVTTAAISPSVHPDPTGLLCQDVVYLMRLLEIAQGKTRIHGTSTLWQPGAKGYRFSPQAYCGKADAFAADTELRMHNQQVVPLWTSMHLLRPVLLDVEWIDAPLWITLFDGQYSVAVLHETNGHIRVC